MKISHHTKNYKRTVNKKYFSGSDVGVGNDKDKKFWWVCEPLDYYVGKAFEIIKEEEGYEVTGEGYIFYDEADYKKHIRELNKELENKGIHYCFYDKKGNLIKEQ